MNQDKDHVITIAIPATTKSMIAACGGIERVVMAKGWQRAAIVWAWTYEPGKGAYTGKAGREHKSEIRLMTCKDFAALGIPGLQSKDTVYEYRRNWQAAIDHGEAIEVQPGDDNVMLPDRPYPWTQRRGGVTHDMTDATPLPEKIAATKKFLDKNPDVERAIAERMVPTIGKDVGLASKVMRVYEEHHPAPTPRPSAASQTPMVVYAFGTVVYGAVQRTAPQLQELLDHLAAQESHVERLEETLDDLAKARELISQMEDRIRAAAGINYDAVFERLTKGDGR